MIRPVQLSDVVSRLKPGMTVFIPGTTGESLGFFEALKQAPEKAAGVLFIGVHFPGLNQSDYLGLHPTTTQRAYFSQPGFREPMRSGRVDLMPLDYPGVWRDLQRQRIDLAIAQVSPPGADGKMSLGTCYDFFPAVWANAAMRVAHVNPAMPRTRGSFSIDPADCDLICDQETPLVMQVSGDPSPELSRIGSLVAGLVGDGDTIQLGIGKMQSAVVRALRNHRGLRVHSGMVTEEIVGLLDSGAIQGDASVVTGVALGDERFYCRVAADPAFHFTSVDQTHDVCRIAMIPGFVSINAALEVDLFGQVNCDCLDGRLVAGVGGMPPFTAGARLSKGGRAIFCLTSTAGKGAVSRIVAKLGPSSAVGAPRHAADVVITENGAVDLSRLSIHQRAEQLIKLAAPEFREQLASQWRDVSSAL